MMTFRHVAVSLLALVMSTQVVSAFTEGDYNYSINSDGESVTLVSCYKGISGAVNIPSHAYKKDYTGGPMTAYKVTAIEDFVVVK